MADINFAVASAAMPTANGPIEIIKPAMKFKPKAALFVASFATASRTKASHLNLMYGCVTETAEWCISGHCRDAANTSVTHRGSGTSAIFMLDDALAVDAVATGVGDGVGSNPGFIDNGIRLNFTNAPASAFQLAVLFFGGADLQVQAGVTDDLATADVVPIGFEPELFFFASAFRMFNNGANGTNLLNLAAAMYKTGVITQRRISYDAQHNVPSTEGRHVLSTNSIAGYLGTGDRGSLQAVNHAGASSTFTIGADAGSLSQRSVGYLAMNLGGNDYHVGHYALPNSAAAQWNVKNTAVTPTIAMQPTAQISFFTHLNTVDVTDIDGPEVASFGIGAHDGTDQRCVSWTDRDARSTSIAKSYFSDSDFIYAWDYEGTAEQYDVRNPVYTADGFEVAAANIDAASGNTSLAFGVFLDTVPGALNGGGNGNSGGGGSLSLSPIALSPIALSPIALSPIALGGVGGPAPWTPAELFQSGEQGAWYDIQDLSTMWQDENGTVPAVVDSVVGRIDDQSPNGNHATQSDTNKKPILRQSGSLYYLEGAIDDSLSIPGAMSGATSDDMTNVISSAANSLNSFQVILGQSPNYAGLTSYFDGSHFHRLAWDPSTAATQIFTHSSQLVVSQRFTRTDAIDLQNNDVRLTVNDVTESASSAFAVDKALATSNHLFSLNNNSNFYNGRIYRVISIARLLTAQEQQDAETWVGYSPNPFPLSLFDGGEQGAIYDVQDISTMWQDGI